MNENAPWRPDLKSILTGVQNALILVYGSLSFLPLEDTQKIVAAVAIGAFMAILNGMLGVHNTAALAVRDDTIKGLSASVAVFKTDAPISVQRQAEAAASAVVAPVVKATEPASTVAP